MFDFDIVTTRQGYVGAAVSPEHIETAKQRYLERQRRCVADNSEHQFNPDDMPAEDVDTERDHRWSGDLGEMMVKDYLEQRAYDHHWRANVRESEYDPDFFINRINIDVKTKRRKHIPRFSDDYFETVHHDQFVLAKTRDIKGFIFCDYAYAEGWIYIVGKISYEQFDRIKIERNPGDQPHENYRVHAKSWDVPITSLAPPVKWQKAQ